MKKLIIIMMAIFLVSGIWSEVAAQPFSGRTKHKLMKRMTRHQVGKAQKGKTLYYHHKGKLHKRR
jgi:hypothetical protein